MMNLREIIGRYPVSRIQGSTTIPIQGIRFDSRMVMPGDLFFAIRGTASDGHDFINMALEKGASAVVCEQIPEAPVKEATFIAVESSSRALGFMAATFHGDPSAKLRLVGVTGTNGKTTTVTLLHGLFLALGHRAGMISTIRHCVNETEFPSTHTTPDPATLNSLLERMNGEGCEYCFMEVSSHAVNQDRIAGLTFSGGVFTNLTHDHLDYHKTFDAYLKAKKAFFDLLPGEAFALINKDDRNGMVMLQNTAARKHTYSLQSMADFRCRILESQFHGLHLSMDGSEAWFRLTGVFNAYNLLAAYGAAVLLGEKREGVLQQLSRMEPVAGRFNYLISPEKVTAIVDYAHTPDALKNVLETIAGIRTHRGQVITVVGAGGNRDAAKRPLMARIAATLSDRVILTSDNPRNEEPGAILAEMRSGLDPKQLKKTLTITDRYEAIKTACAMAKPGDIILVAGKGHETYQEMNGVRHHFDDREVIREMFRNDQDDIKR